MTSVGLVEVSKMVDGFVGGAVVDGLLELDCINLPCRFGIGRGRGAHNLELLFM